MKRRARMQDGYYWYFPADEDTIPDLSNVQIVEVYDDGTRVAVCGSDVTHDVEACGGRFVGPLLPSEKHGSD